MSDYVHLVGAEDVRTAAITMRSAAEQMQQAALNIDGALERHQRFLDEWLQRFEAVMSTPKPLTADEIKNSNTLEAQIAAREFMRAAD